MKPNRKEQEVLDYLEDGQWHCMASPDFYMKDDRSRISALIKKGYDIEPAPCDGRCGMRHNSRLLMRRLKNPRPFKIRVLTLPDGTVVSQEKVYG